MGASGSFPPKAKSCDDKVYCSVSVPLREGSCYKQEVKTIKESNRELRTRRNAVIVVLLDYYNTSD